MKAGKQQIYEIYNHRLLWGASQRNLELAGKPEPDGKYFAMASMLLAFLALEGYLNWLGELLFPKVWKKERRFFAKEMYPGTLGKLRYLREHLELPGLHSDSRPLSSAVKLHEVRNFLAHSKPERGTREVHFEFPEPPPHPNGFLADSCTDACARIMSDDIKTLADDLHHASQQKHGDRVPNASPFCGLLGFSSTDI